METMILDLNFVLLSSQDPLKEYSKNLFAITVNNHASIFGGLYVLEGNTSGAHPN